MQESETTTVVEPNPFTERLPKPENGQDKTQPASEAVKSATVKVETTKKRNWFSQGTTRKRRRGVFGVLHGPPGVGKSTFGAGMPKAAMIPVERGLDQIGGVFKFPTPENFVELCEMIHEFDTEDHEHQSLVIDTLDATQALIWDRVLEEANKKENAPKNKPRYTSIEDFGYGKGYVYAGDLWLRLLAKLIQMSERFNILLIAHSQLKTINVTPPFSIAYDQYRIKIHEKSADLVRQAADLILFANLDVTVQKDVPKARKGRAIVNDDRLMWVAPASGIEAKNRYNLESPMEFSWAALAEGIEKFYAS